MCTALLQGGIHASLKVLLEIWEPVCCPGCHKVAHACMPSAQLFVQDNKGVKEVTFPQAAKGFRDFLFYDRSIQVSVGNRGSLTILVPQQS